MIETEVIKMSNKKMLAVLFSQYGKIWLFVTLLGFAACLFFGIFFNYRFFFLSLIWIFLFIPLVITFLYFFYGMLPLTAFNCIPHKIEATESELKVIIAELNKDETDSSSNEKDYIVNNTSFKKLKLSYDYALIFFNNQGWLWLPVNAFIDINQFLNFINIYKK